MRKRTPDAREAGAIARWMLVAVALWSTGSAAGERVAEVRSLVDAPLAVRGGVMMLPITSGPDILLPERVGLESAGGLIEAVIGWIELGGEPAADSLDAHWTADPLRLRITTLRPQGGGQPVLLARLPEEGGGEIRLGAQRLRPVWIDRAGPLEARTPSSTLAAVTAPYRPDPRSPFEHWRWALLADRLDAAPPSLDRFTEVEVMLAEYTADLWRFALARLSEHNPALALDVRDRLTRLCTDATGDRRAAFAAWVADPNETNRLLNALADVRVPLADLAAEAQAWLDIQPANGAGGGLLMWMESATDARIRLAVVNTAHRAVVARFMWEGPGLADEPPIAIELQPGRLMRVTLDYPQAATRLGRRVPAWSTAQPIQLHIASNVGTYEIPFGAADWGAAVVRAPGLVLPPLRPPLTLSEVAGGPAPTIRSDHAAVVQLRKMRGRWELFFEVMRPGGEEPSTTSPSDAIEVMIGPDDAGGGPDVHLVVPEHGWHELRRGENDGTLQVHRRSYEDRWYCRIVLPDAWLNTLPDEVTLLGVKRTQAGRSASQYSPFAPVPWRPTSSRLAVDLSRWDDRPQ